jgi:hypothetical protein
MSIVKAVLSDNNGHRLEVQFNPETLSIEHETFGEAGRQRSGEEAARGGAEEAGQASVKTGYTTNLSQVSLLFDNSDNGEDVRSMGLCTLLLRMYRCMTTFKHKPVF